MAQFSENSKVYAGNNSVSMFENIKSSGLFSKETADFTDTCITYYRKYLSEQEEERGEYKNLNFLPYSSTPILQRYWLPESFIGVATGKRISISGASYIQVQYDANKITFNNQEMASYSVIQRLAWVSESQVSETGY